MQIDGHSMEPLFKPGQIIIVNRLSYGLLFPFVNKYGIKWSKPAVGDIVVFTNTRTGRLTVKRCIAAENANISVENGLLYVEHITKPLRLSSSLNLENYKCIPEDHIMVLGDNLNNSIDSRAYGFIHENMIIGKVIIF